MNVIMRSPFQGYTNVHCTKGQNELLKQLVECTSEQILSMQTNVYM